MDEAIRSSVMESDPNSLLSASTESSVHSENEEFEVEDILCLAPHQDGDVRRYLVVWAGYPLARATLEPEENLPQEVVQMWEAKLRRIAAGQETPFDLSIWERAVEEAQATKEERARRRKQRQAAKMQEIQKAEQEQCRGLKNQVKTKTGNEKPQLDQRKKRQLRSSGVAIGMNSDSSSDEAVEDNRLEVDHPEKRPKKRKLVQTTFTIDMPTVCQQPPPPDHSNKQHRQSMAHNLRSPVSERFEKLGKATHRNGNASAAVPVTADVPPLVDSQPNRTVSIQDPSSSTIAEERKAPLQSKRRPGSLGLQAQPLVSGRTTTNSSVANTINKTAKAKGGKPTAKKSHLSVGNVFTSGSIPKTRTRGEPTKSKLYESRGALRRAEIRHRDAQDLAFTPWNQVPKSLLPTVPDGSQPVVSTAAISTQNGMSPTLPMPEPCDASTLLSQTNVPVAENDIDTDPQIISHQAKRRKTVRFNVSDEQDILTRVLPDLTLQRPLTKEPVGQAMDIDQTDEPNTIIKPLFIPETEWRANAVLRHWPSANDSLPWVAAITESTQLELKYAGQSWQFMPNSFQAYTQHIGIASVRLDSETHSGAMLTKLLRADHGFLSSTIARSYQVLFVPRKSEEWINITGLPPPPPHENLHGDFRYYILKDYFSEHMSRLPRADIAESVTSKSVLPAMMQEWFGWDFKMILPTVVAAVPSFYLLFPASTRNLYTVVGKWILACVESEALIYCCQDPGSWKLFLQQEAGTVIIHHSCLKLLRLIPMLADALRQRHVFCLLTDKGESQLEVPADIQTLQQEMSINQELEQYSEHEHNQGQQPRTGPNAEQARKQLSRIGLSKIFPAGGAILLTPSFILMEPQHALNLLEWYQQYEMLTHGWVLVGVHNLPGFVFEICLEIARQQANIDAPLRPPHPSIPEAVEDVNKRQLETENMLLRHKLWSQLMALCCPHFSSQVFKSKSFINAPQYIVAHDEQSLVNWFAGWSLLQMSKYRNFYVVGSSRQNWHPAIASITFPIPEYGRRTLTNPDRAWAAELSIRPDIIQHELDDGDEPHSFAAVASNIGATGQHIESSTTAPEQEASLSSSTRSRLFRNDSADEFRAHLRRLSPLPGTRAFFTLYNLPVAWADQDMQEFYQGRGCHPLTWAYERIYDWWVFLRPFKRSNNTYIGMFYTLDQHEPWHAEEHIQGVMPRGKMHPWIAVYRPRNPHQWTTWEKDRKCNLFIWDVKARDYCLDPKLPTLGELPFMQRKLYEFVKEATGQKISRSMLDNFYYGGLDIAEQQGINCRGEHPLDATLMFLEYILLDTRKVLPAAELALRNVGWNIVNDRSPQPHATIMSSTVADSSCSRVTQTASPLVSTNESLPSGAQPNPSKSATEEQNERYEPAYTARELAEENIKLVYHAPIKLPRETIQTNGDIHHNNVTAQNKASKPELDETEKSECCSRNMLLERIQKIRTLKRNAKEIRYTYVPTDQWYNEQDREGRGYSHLTVNSWEAIKQLLPFGSPHGQEA